MLIFDDIGRGRGGGGFINNCIKTAYVILERPLTGFLIFNKLNSICGVTRSSHLLNIHHILVFFRGSCRVCDEADIFKERRLR